MIDENFQPKVRKSYSYSQLLISIISAETKVDLQFSNLRAEEICKAVIKVIYALNS